MHELITQIVIYIVFCLVGFGLQVFVTKVIYFRKKVCFQLDLPPDPKNAFLVKMCIELIG